MITQTYNIDLIPSGVPTIVHVSQYDSASRTIAMSIYDGGVAYDLTDKIVTVRGTKQDNTGFEYPCTVDGNVASFVLNAQMTIFSGDVPCEIRIAENGFVIGSHNFVLRVERTPLDSSIVISDTELPLIEEAEQNAIRAEQAADEAEELLSTVVKSVNSVTPDAQGNVDVVALPTGGTAGQYLRKESSVDGDADWQNIDASSVVYDNTSSGLTATDVQAAIDETSLLGGRYFYNRTVTTWASDSTYSDYPYKGTINITGVTDADGVEVTFSNADATSGNYSPICATFNGGVYIWSKTQDTSIIIPTICIYGRSNEDLSGEFPYLSLEGGTVRGDVTITGRLTVPDISVEVLTPTLVATDNFAITQASLYKMGRIVVGSIVLQCTADWTSGVVVRLNHSLPAYIFSLCSVTNGQWAYAIVKNVRAYIPTSGNITINTAITAGQFVTIPIAIAVL